jgi:amino acid adenylation domain-containing protein
VPLSLVALLRRSAKEHPQRPAVSAPGGRALDYAGLERESGRIARSLIAAGVSRGDRVGILIPKGVEAVTAVWGAMRAGAAYVPIDPTAPGARAAVIAGNCSMAALLASSDVADAVAAVRAAVPGLRVFQVHGAEPLAGARAVEDAAAAVEPTVNTKDLAYILYTSGSTGVPKGVMVSHAAALSFVEWAVGRFAVSADDVLSSHAPLHFDLSTFDLFAAAMAGAKLVVLDEETVRFPMAAADVMEQERISVWYSVPGALRGMLRGGRLDKRDLAALRTVLFAGEAYPADELRQLQSVLAHVALFNLYGPTETNVCTYWPVPPAGTWSEAQVPIGIDCENDQGLVVDEELRPVPDGTAGELLMRGGTLMEGYWGDPERTKAGFVSNLLYPHLQDRFYRTGDLVTRRPDGGYAFHGRRDHMVKVRGYRVELGEVEAALHRGPGVVEAAVAPATRGEGETELVGFVAGLGEDPPADGVRALKRHLAGLLPKYMVPSEFVWLRRLPTTSTGKVDRQALLSAARDLTRRER